VQTLLQWLCHVAQKPYAAVRAVALQPSIGASLSTVDSFVTRRCATPHPPGEMAAGRQSPADAPRAMTGGDFRNPPIEK
jgi:hypothetical protein